MIGERKFPDRIEVKQTLDDRGFHVFADYAGGQATRHAAGHPTTSD